MKKPKLTKWFDGSVKPVRDGVYERWHGDTVVFAKFQYGFWRWEHSTIKAASEQHKTTVFQKRPWRGLAQNPEDQ